jgi:hypothetical protein
MNTKFNVYIYVCFVLFPLLYYNYSFICLYKGYTSYIHISRGYVKHKRLRTTGLDKKLCIYVLDFTPCLQLIICNFHSCHFLCISVTSTCTLWQKQFLKIIILNLTASLFPSRSIDTGFVSHLGNISKHIGIECEVVLGNVQVPLKQNISYQSTRII